MLDFIAPFVATTFVCHFAPLGGGLLTTLTVGLSLALALGVARLSLGGALALLARAGAAGRASRGRNAFGRRSPHPRASS